MSSNSKQSDSVEVAEKRKPVTVAQCVFNIVLYGAYGCALTHVSARHSGWSLLLYGLWAAINYMAAVMWLRNLRHVLRGDKAEYIFTPVQKRESFVDILMNRFGSTFIAVLVTAASIHLFYLPGPTSFAGAATILLANIAAWRGAYHAWTRDRNYKKEPDVKFASEEAAKCAKAIEKAEKVLVPAGASMERTAVGHWWTDTPLREENQQRVGR